MLVGVKVSKLDLSVFMKINQEVQCALILTIFYLGVQKTFSNNTTELLMNNLTAGMLCVYTTFVCLGWNLKQNEKYINAQTKYITLEKSKETIQTKFVNLKKKQELGKFEQENNPEILDGSIGINNLYLLIYVY